MRAVVVGVSAVVLLQLLVVAMCWRLGAMRSRAVVEPFAEEEPDGSVWDALDRHLADQPPEVLTDADHFAVWEKELAS